MKLRNALTELQAHGGDLVLIPRSNGFQVMQASTLRSWTAPTAYKAITLALTALKAVA